MSETIQSNPISRAEIDDMIKNLTDNGNVAIKLNVGCGNSKLEDYINIDINQDNKPDIALDMRAPLPLSDKCVSEILFFHTIEHIEEKYHFQILAEFRRVLKDDGLLFISYPEFKKCAQNYINNYRGDRLFWKHTIYGLQRSEDDFHVTLMDTDFFTELLQEVGFRDIEYQPEKNEPFNTIIKASPGKPQVNYETLLAEAIFP